MARATDIHRRTFKAGSKTYFNATRFFPPAVRDDVFLLYGFVRTADNFVDRVPQDREGYLRFVDSFRDAAAGIPANDPIIDGFVSLADRKGFPTTWVEAFIKSMSMDLDKRVHATLPETLEYVHGSAEVIGLYMARILDLPIEADFAAERLGRAMQFINFIRDIDEDVQLGRTYLPISETHFSTLAEAETRADPDEFIRFIGKQLERYERWLREAEQGYRFIPHRYRTAIRTAGDMYNWTAKRIRRDPFVVYRMKVTPTKRRIVARGVANAMRFWP